MIYIMECGCGRIGEFEFSMHDPEKRAPCPRCGAMVTDRRFDLEGVQIQGDTVPGGCTYNYYDDNLGCQIGSKQQRADEMKRQGLQDYAPHPQIAEAQREARYQMKQAAPHEKSAATSAARKTIRDAKKEVNGRIQSERFDKQAREIERSVTSWD